MANTLHGPYAKTAWTNGSTPISQGNLNNLETQVGVALASLNPNLISAGFVLTGATCTKDGVNANQLDIASGTAFLIQSDGTLAQCDIAADNTHTTGGNPSTTLFLDLNPDGSWSFGTSHSAVTNHLTICSVTTDASSNISSVTDTRPLNVELLTAMQPNGSAFVDVQALGLLAPDLGASKRGSIGHLDNTGGVFSNAFFFNTPMSGASAQGFYFASWNGSATQIPLSLGGNFGGAAAWIGGLGNIGAVGGQASAGSFGVPVIVAQAINQHITSTANQTLASFTPPADGLYVAYASFVFSNGSNSTITMRAAFTDPLLGTGVHALFSTTNGFTNALAFIATPGTTVPAAPITFYAKGGSAITLEFQDTTGTPSDHVTMQLMRLS